MAIALELVVGEVGRGSIHVVVVCRIEPDQLSACLEDIWPGPL